MKTYEKPRLMVLSVSANDALCSGCDDAVRNNAELREYFGIYYGGEDGVLDDIELESLFAGTDGCSTQVSYNGYCKFTGANRMFSS